MKNTLFVLMLAGFLPLLACEPDNVAQSMPTASPVVKEMPKTETPGNPVVKMVTSMGEIHVEVYMDKSPITAENFLTYVKAGHYNGTIFHRVMKGFMIQGGGFEGNLQKKPTRAPIKNETYNKLRNKRGTISMARQNAPNSATCQFFINHVDNKSLDFDGLYPPGYAVFGKVIKGMDVVDAIASVKVRTISMAFQYLPVEKVLIESVTVVE